MIEVLVAIWQNHSNAKITLHSTVVPGAKMQFTQLKNPFDATISSQNYHILDSSKSSIAISRQPTEAFNLASPIQLPNTNKIKHTKHHQCLILRQNIINSRIPTVAFNFLCVKTYKTSSMFLLILINNTVPVSWITSVVNCCIELHFATSNTNSA